MQRQNEKANFRLLMRECHHFPQTDSTIVKKILSNSNDNIITYSPHQKWTSTAYGISENVCKHIQPCELGAFRKFPVPKSGIPQEGALTRTFLVNTVNMTLSEHTVCTVRR